MTSVESSRTSAQIVAGLRDLGYCGALLERNYSFPDWFANRQVRTLDAAAFGRTPVSYESACIGIAHANGLRKQGLVDAFRAFGAPVLLEIDGTEVREWAVSRVENQHTLVGSYSADNIPDIISDRAEDWKPDSMLRARSIGTFTWVEQLGLFSGLIPELEVQIQSKLDPLLRETLSCTRQAYVESSGRDPKIPDLFKLVFWMLTAKVCSDRRHREFSSLAGDPTEALNAVAEHYGVDAPQLLNQEARAAAARNVWRELDFRNLSVEVLAHIWSRTLIDQETRKRLGIHRTPRSIVRYIVERTIFPQVGDDDRIVFEPCSGSASFLIGALNFMRPNLVFSSPRQRHQYFVKRLAGMEFDAFGVETSMLALTLADFPNPNGWRIERADVFAPKSMTSYLSRAAVVLCNPPFEAFDQDSRRRYQATEVRKPAELLRRILADLHPQGVLGFVLPYNAVDGRSYAGTRQLLADRYASIELTVLPERSFEDSETDIAVLIAKEPIPHRSTRVAFRRVRDNEEAWSQFVNVHTVSSEYSRDLSIDDARGSLVLTDLPEVWDFLIGHYRLGDVAEVHRGIEWRSKITSRLHVRREPARGFMLGVPPKAKFDVFQAPELKYLNVQPGEQRVQAWKLDWFRPKAVVPKARRSRGHWRMTSFPDNNGLVVYQTFYGIWPHSDAVDEVVLSAILNSPVANAFVATREGNRDITAEVLRSIPVPSFSPHERKQLRELIGRYQAATHEFSLKLEPTLELLLKRIDACVLDAYHMPPRLERQVLDYFNGEKRRVAHPFGGYFPSEFDVFVPLSEYLDPRFSKSTVGELVKTFEAE